MQGGTGTGLGGRAWPFLMRTGLETRLSAQDPLGSGFTATSEPVATDLSLGS